MSVVLKPTTAKIRNEGGEFQGFNVIADEKTSEKIAAIETKGNEVLESIPEDYDEILGEINNLKEDIDDIVGNYYKTNSISAFADATKLEGYSFGVYETKVSGFAHSSYDSYYFYTDKETGLYFENAAPSTPSYISLTVGYNPSKNWKNVGGQMQMDCDSSVRKRKSENNLPTSSDPFDVSEAIVIITVNTGTTIDFYINNGLQLQSEVILAQTQIAQVLSSIIIEKMPRLVYTTAQEFSNEGSTEQINIFLPTAYGYIRYAFGHSEDASINADSWRIFRAIAVDDGFVDRFSITTKGEWEMALKINGGTDFIGGLLHGDEVLEDITFFIDGKEVTISTITTATEFSELRIVENTLLYNPDEPTENVAKHSKEYIFTADGLTINQRVLWLMAKTLTTSYSCMFPLIRGKDTVSALQVTADYYDNNDYKTYDVSVGGMSGYPFTWHRNVTKANFWSDESGIFASAEIIKQPSLTGGDMSFLQNTVNQYNKLYYSICGIGNTYDTTVNEVWKWTSQYRITAAKVV